ncbi:MAG: LPP20 family lipoprotein [Candidatus Marinarcus sp.]|uniref:LPP20 family lipoprotein n=1 Tax=Candidatus Marinarcus sp. TaxID=3100987 RepID=UPI003B003A35
MKKILLSTSAALFAASVLFTGCTSSQESIQADMTYVDPEFQGAPKWVMVPSVPGFIAEVGSAPKNAANDRSFQREEAMADARDNIARQISINVDNLFKSFKAATGTGADATFDRSSERVSKQLASQTLNNTIVKDTWISKTGNLYVLMAVDTNTVADATEDAIKTSFKNDKALYQKFLASKAQGELNEELEKLKSK